MAVLDAARTIVNWTTTMDLDVSIGDIRAQKKSAQETNARFCEILQVLPDELDNKTQSRDEPTAMPEKSIDRIGRTLAERRQIVDGANARMEAYKFDKDAEIPLGKYKAFAIMMISSSRGQLRPCLPR